MRVGPRQARAHDREPDLIQRYIILWLLAAAFVAYVARRYGRNPWVWFLVGLAVPFLSVALVFAAGEPRADDEEEGIIPFPKQKKKKGPDEPNCRCQGHYIPECHSCPFFRKPTLFGETDPSVAGYCEKYNRTLWKDDMK